MILAFIMTTFKRMDLVQVRHVTTKQRHGDLEARKTGTSYHKKAHKKVGSTNETTHFQPTLDFRIRGRFLESISLKIQNNS